MNNEPQQAFIFHQGKYFVKYPHDESVGFKGGNSRCMTWSTAHDYAEIFGGTVHRHPAFPTLWKRLRNFLKKLTRTTH